MPRGARATSWATRPEPSSVGAAPGRLRGRGGPTMDGMCLLTSPASRNGGRPRAVPVGNLFGTCPPAGAGRTGHLLTGRARGRRAGAGAGAGATVKRLAGARLVFFLISLVGGAYCASLPRGGEPPTVLGARRRRRKITLSCLGLGVARACAQNPLARRFYRAKDKKPRVVGVMIALRCCFFKHNLLFSRVRVFFPTRRGVKIALCFDCCGLHSTLRRKNAHRYAVDAAAQR